MKEETQDGVDSQRERTYARNKEEACFGYDSANLSMRAKAEEHSGW